MNPALPEWTGDSAGLRALQAELARQVVRRDAFAKPLRTIAGFAVGVEDDGATTRAAAVLLDAETLDALDQQVARLPTRMPYLPGLRGFRQLPAMLEALAMLKHPPDLAFIDGHGIAHPRRFGLAAHFGVVTGLPSIGVAGKILVGEARMALHDMRGAFTPLRDGREQIGWLLRSKAGSPPLIVSPGHKMAMPSAPELVMRYVGRHRLPEPVRLAHLLSSPPDADAGELAADA
ncbi:MAG: deoxyribonuclease V [Lysobacteraceae bacterium]|nr:MAG: deoxyribonuclease V [Xanthomonadaceae bacterium]